jgi:PAS domain-containing protein
MPGMLRAEFSSRNKLKNLELTYDAMGFMQQLARASGKDSTAQIIPSSVEMALTPSPSEARVITMAQPPYLIMNVNEQWTRLTGYTQMDAEGKEYLSLIEGEHTISWKKLQRTGTTTTTPKHVFEDVARGRPVCSTNIHYDKAGTDFIEFVASFPLTNESDEVTHLLHISKELPSVMRDSDY